MRRYFHVATILIGIFLPRYSDAQIPINPNKTDSKGNRQGRWTICYDQNWNPVSDTLSAQFYRIINYQNNKPSGIVHDFYKNGKPQFSCLLIEDRPKEIYSGTATWFNEEGIKEASAEFTNGQQGNMTIFFTDGTPILEHWNDLNQMGMRLVQQEKLNEALVYFQKAKIRALYEFGREHKTYATAVFNLAYLFGALNNHAAALPLFSFAKDFQAKMMGKEDPTYIATLRLLLNTYVTMGHYREAVPLAAELSDYNAKVLGKTHPDYAQSLNTLAVMYWNLADYPSAIALYSQSGEIYSNAPGKESDYATTLSNLGTLYTALNDYPKALHLFTEAQQIRAKAFGKQHPDYANSLHNLGQFYFSIGAYTKSEAYFLEAKTIQEKSLGKEHPEYSVTINNLALVYSTMGDFAKAIPLYEERIAIDAKAFGKEHPENVPPLNNLGSVFVKMGTYQKAEPLFLEAMHITEKALGRDHPNYSISLNNLASLYSDMGAFSKAEPLLLEAINIRAKVFGKMHSAYATSLNNLAYFHWRTENYSKAIPLLMEAKDIRFKALGAEHPDYVVTLNNLGELHTIQAEYQKAEPFYLESISKKLLHIARFFPSLSENEKKAFYATSKPNFQNFETFCLARVADHPAILNDWFNLRLSIKGLLFNTSNKMRERILTGGDTVLIELYNQWKAKKDFLAKVYQMTTEEKQKTGMDEKKLEEEANTIEKLLSLKSELFATAADTQAYTWRDVQQKLKPGEAAIEVVRTERKKGKDKSTVYAAMFIDRKMKNHPEVIILENGADLEGKFSNYYRNAVKQKIKDELSYNQYWNPIADKIKGARKVYFSADGVYNQINLNTLYNPATGKYVIDEVEVQMVTSTKDLITNTKATRAGIKDATLFGYPNYNNSKMAKPDSSRALNLGQVKTAEIKTDSATRFFNGENINELPGTKIEVETIEALLKKKNIAMHEYMFDKATETEIKRLNNPQVLHIATHGFFLSDLPAPKENERGFAGMEIKKIVENPLLRSGLLFAGVKNAFQSRGTTPSGATTNDDEDGILTAYEAMSLDLDQTDLVVMSACETGLGVTSNGEGVYGLQRAFQVAGAKSVLMSLWTVSDEATQQLMTMFYENWLGGKTPREAFRMAQLSLRTKYPEPYYWGAFVLVGE